MAVYRLKREQLIPATLAEVWTFFSGAGNLQAITPASMNFRVTNGPLPAVVYPGQIITYKVSPILGIPLFWMTEITHVIPQILFVDEARRGPYRMWHHEHHFEEREGGVWMTDIVHYELPFWILGNLAHVLFVRRMLVGIFDYRTKKVNELFPGTAHNLS